ncbi:MAG: hypothetical protein HOO06_05640 [Bdellovibrionaceae bacterium]|jgi:photosystem II stability/assembly factor-like uncharacterized protein|nr:hypothetical protein [Pseudobdellovibrionaceae bacterium]
MIIFLKFNIFLSLFLFTFSSTAEVIHSLKGKVVRSLSLDYQSTNKILVGNKGAAVGSAFVYESRNFGKTWKVLNSGKPLSPQATDVQSVAYTPKLILAGTWKHGLFLSMDNGNSFKKSKTISSSDIRDIKIVESSPLEVYLATSDSGLFKSIDGGLNWKKLKVPNEFFWSLNVLASGQVITASSLDGRVYLSKDSGNTWNSIIEIESPFFAEVNPLNINEVVVVSEKKGVLRSTNKEEEWEELKFPGISKSFSSASYLSSGELILGTWDNGLINLNLATGVYKHSLAQIPVVHVKTKSNLLVIGTWGSGLFVVK